MSTKKDVSCSSKRKRCIACTRQPIGSAGGGGETLNYNNILSCFKITLHSGVLSDEANDVQSYELSLASVVVHNTMLTNGW